MIESPEALIEKAQKVLKSKEPALLNAAEKFETLWGGAKYLVAVGMQAQHKELEGLGLVDLVPAIMERAELREGFLDLSRQIYRAVEPNERRSFQEVLRHGILDHLGRPHPITLRETWTIAEREIPLSSEICEDHVQDFGKAVVRKFSRYRDGRRALVATTLAPDSLEPVPRRVIWKSEWIEAEIEVARVVKRAHYEDFKPPKQFTTGNVYLRLSGWGTRAALRNARKEFIHLLRAVFWIIADLEGSTAGGDGGLPPLPHELSPHSNFISEAIDSYFAPQKMKDESAARFRNAIHLMVQAVSQRHDAVALVLYCSAIEALLSRGKESITKTLADDVATLLEPDRKARVGAIKFVKELYNLRSRSLHGDGLSGERSQRANARALASNVLSAVLERKAFTHRLGMKPESRDAVLKDLEDARVTGEAVLGITPRTVRSLWSKQQPRT